MLNSVQVYWYWLSNKWWSTRFIKKNVKFRSYL